MNTKQMACVANKIQGVVPGNSKAVTLFICGAANWGELAALCEVMESNDILRADEVAYDLARAKCQGTDYQPLFDAEDERRRAAEMVLDAGGDEPDGTSEQTDPDQGGEAEPGGASDRPLLEPEPDDAPEGADEDQEDPPPPPAEEETEEARVDA